MMLGRSHPDVAAAIKEQVDDGIFYTACAPWKSFGRNQFMSQFLQQSASGS